MACIDIHLNRLLESRDYPKTICPSEVARALSADELAEMGTGSWRDLMGPIRTYVFELRNQGKVEILQRGEVLPLTQGFEQTSGPIRVRYPE